MKIAVVAAVAWVAVSSAFGDGVLFPTPLHLARRIDDPIARSTTSVDEYCYGNRIVTVNGLRVAIADYGEQVLTEIDHERVTYSITRFDDIAKARPPKASAKSKSEWTMTSLGVKTSAAMRSVESYEFAGGGRKLEIGIDRSVTLSRDAVEALIGAAYPNQRTEEHEQLLRAAAASGGRIVALSTVESIYGLPADQSVAFDNGLTFRSVIVRIDRDLPPQQRMLVDPGATRVESRLTRITREMQQLDSLPTFPVRH